MVIIKIPASRSGMRSLVYNKVVISPVKHPPKKARTIAIKGGIPFIRDYLEDGSDE